MQYNPLLITFHKAADLLEKDGWTQHTMYRWDFADDKCEVCVKTQRCVLGALRDVASNAEDYTNAHLALAQYIKAAVSNWNDQEGQTLENVARTLRSIV